MINLSLLLNARRVRVTYEIDDVNSEYVKGFRDKNNLTKAGLANLMGVSVRTIERWERGESRANYTCCVLFTLFSHNDGLIEQIRKVEIIEGE